MSIALYRIDDRLIHGQVVVGWGKPLNVRFIVLVDDAVRVSAWEQELYRMGVPADIEVVFASTEEALERLPEWENDPRVGILAAAMLGDVATGLQLGVLFELFQYDILPMGATRYPEYGPATVAAVSAAHAATGTLGLGLGALVGLITGMVGGLSLHGLRQLNTRAVRRGAAALEAGDPRVLERVHAAGD